MPVKFKDMLVGKNKYDYLLSLGRDEKLVYKIRVWFHLFVIIPKSRNVIGQVGKNAKSYQLGNTFDGLRILWKNIETQFA